MDMAAYISLFTCDIIFPFLACVFTSSSSSAPRQYSSKLDCRLPPSRLGNIKNKLDIALGLALVDIALGLASDYYK